LHEAPRCAPPSDRWEAGFCLKGRGIVAGLILVAAASAQAQGGAREDAATHVSPAALSSAQRLDLHLTPPIANEIVVTPLKKATAEGNAQLSIAYAADARLKSTLDVRVGEKIVPFKQSAKTNQMIRFTGVMDFDFEEFSKEQAERAELAKRGVTVPVFEGRRLVRTEKIQFIDPALVKRALVAKAALHIPIGIFKGLPPHVDSARELMVTDTSVVEDPSRTFDGCSAQGAPMGAWTFGKLMTDMANQAQTGTDPSVFVEQWLKTWDTDQHALQPPPNPVNSFTIAKRPAIDSLVLNNWPRINGKLDLSKAPMRLLAIVNRIDLRDNVVYGPGGNAGEGRFVFGVLNRGATGCQVSQFTVILEYGVPIHGCVGIHGWAQQWHHLSTLTLGSPAYNAALQAITDQFAKAGADPSKPNGSALDQLRTDEIALAGPWELREFHIESNDHLLHVFKVNQTPDSSLLNSAAVTSYVNANAASILNNSYSIPELFPGAAPFQGGSSLNNVDVWRGTPVPANNDARNGFSLGACDSCHGGETSTTFKHIEPRQAGQPTQLSKFLVGNGTPAAPSTFTMNDPVVAATPRTYGDLVRRQQDMDTLLAPHVCRGFGIIRDSLFKPLKMSD